MSPRDLVPPFRQLASSLRTKIAEGELLPGEQLPSLDRLAGEYGVSRTTARRAIQLLADEGLVTVIERWGTFVSPRPGSTSGAQ